MDGLMINMLTDDGWLQLQCVPCGLAGRIRTWHAPTTNAEALAAAVRRCADHGQIEHETTRNGPETRQNRATTIDTDR